MDRPAGPASALPTPAASTDDLVPLPHLDDARRGTRDRSAGVRLEALRAAVVPLREALRASGRPSGITTGDLALRAHGTGRALGRAVRSPVPTLWLTHRVLVVQWPQDGRTVTLLWFADDGAPIGRGGRRLGTVLGHLRALGIAPEHVDLLAGPDLQHADLRPWLGTTRPAPDLGPADVPLEPALPTARLLVRGAEWDTLARPHPLQRAAYRPEAATDLPPERIARLDHDVLLGPGVALLGTPGRTPGTVSLALHTDEGLVVASANGVAADAWAPRASRLPGLRHHAVTRGEEVVPARTHGDDLTGHHDAMIVERALADPAESAPFPRCVPLAELTPHRLAPGLRPTHTHGHLRHGLVRGSRIDVTTAPS